MSVGQYPGKYTGQYAGKYPGGTVSGSSYLDSISGLNVEFELDATVSDSYGGSGQTWANLTASPNSGAAQTDYDAYMGNDGTADTTDPTFTGSSGDAAAYMAYDGGDMHRGKASANTSFIHSLHQSGVDWWFAIAYKPALAVGKAFFDTRYDAGGISTEGVYIQENNGSPRIIRRAGGSNTITNMGSISDATDTLAIFSRDSANDLMYYWINTTSGSSAAAVWSANTANAGDNLFTIFSQNISSPSGQIGSGARGYHISMGGVLMTDALAAQVYSNLNARHNRTYA